MSLTEKSPRHQDRCVSCGRLQARFDNHIDACYACLRCSQHATCPICEAWPAEHWASLAARRARRDRAKACKPSSDGPSEKKAKSSPTADIPLPPLPFSPPLDTAEAQEGDASENSPAVELSTSETLGLILTQMSTLAASVVTVNSRMELLEGERDVRREASCHMADPLHQTAAGGPIQDSSRPGTPRADNLSQVEYWDSTAPQESLISAEVRSCQADILPAEIGPRDGCSPSRSLPRGRLARRSAVPVNRSTGQPVSRSAGQPVSRSPGQSVSRSAGHPVNRSPGHPVNRSAGQPVSRSAGQPVSRSAGQPVSRSTGQPVNRSAGQPVNRSTGQPVSRATDTDQQDEVYWSDSSAYTSADEDATVDDLDRPVSLTDNLQVIRSLMEELVPTEVQKSRKLRSLVHTEETAVNSFNLPMSGPTQDALRMQLDDSTSGPSFKPAAYRFLPVEEDSTPLSFVRTPAKEVGLERFGRKAGSSTKLTIARRDAYELWAQSRQRLGVSSLQDWGLAALQRSISSIQALPSDGSAAELVSAQLLSIQQQVSFLGRTWLDGMALDSSGAVRWQRLLRDDVLSGMVSLDSQQKKRLRSLQMTGDSLFNGELDSKELVEESTRKLQERSLGDMCSLLRRVAAPARLPARGRKSGVRQFPFSAPSSSRPAPPPPPQQSSEFPRSSARNVRGGTTRGRRSIRSGPTWRKRS